jgi:hypothetical protein
MPLGDSITGSPGCWRARLWNRLQSAGLTNIDFVGTQAPQGCGVPYDRDGEGHGGALVTAVADQTSCRAGWPRPIPTSCSCTSAPTTSGAPARST